MKNTKLCSLMVLCAWIFLFCPACKNDAPSKESEVLTVREVQGAGKMFVSGGILYVLAGGEELYAFDAGSKALLWEAKGISRDTQFKLSGDILFYKFYTEAGGGSYHLAGMDTKTGKQLWSNTDIQGAISNFEIYNDVVLLSTERPYRLYGLNPLTGEIKWMLKLERGEEKSGLYAESPKILVQNNIIYTATVSIEKEEVNPIAVELGTGKKIWESAFSFDEMFIEGEVLFLESEGEVKALSLENGSVLWKKDISYYADPVFHKGNVIYLCPSGADEYAVDCLEACDAKTGKPVWKIEKTFEAIESNGFVVKNGKLYVKDEKLLYAFNPETGEILWKTKDPVSIQSFGFRVVLNDVLYGTDGHSEQSNFIAVDTNTGKTLWSVKSEFGNGEVFEENGVLYVSSERGALLDKKTGKRLLELHSVLGENEDVAKFKLQNGFLFVNTSSKKLYVFEASSGKLLYEKGDVIDFECQDGRLFTRGTNKVFFYAFHPDMQKKIAEQLESDYKKAELLFNSEKLKEAKALADEIVSVDPSYAPVYKLLANVCEKQGDILCQVESLEHFTSLTEDASELEEGVAKLFTLSGIRVNKKFAQEIIWLDDLRGNVLCGAGAKTLLCIDVLTGKTLWEETMGASILKRDEGGLYVLGGKPPVLHILNTRTGKTLWSSKGVLEGSVFKVAREANALYAGTSDGAVLRLYALEPKTYAILWQSKMKRKMHDDKLYRVRIYNGMMWFISENAKRVETLAKGGHKTFWKIKGDKGISSLDFDSRSVLISSFESGGSFGYAQTLDVVDIKSGEKRWSKEDTSGIDNFTVYNGSLYARMSTGGTDGDTSLVCIDPKTGKVLWSASPHAGVSDFHFYQDVAYIRGCSRDAPFHLSSVSLKTGKTLWSDEKTLEDDPVSVAILNGKVYVATSSSLVVLDAATRAVLWKHPFAEAGYGQKLYAGGNALALAGKKSLYVFDIRRLDELISKGLTGWNKKEEAK